MNQTICIVYKPGAYGSFIAWAVERFSAIRKKYTPAVMDNPLLKDGSSHGYASFCKIKTNDDFMQGLELSRNNSVQWRHQIFAGWPNADINTSVQSILDWMTAFDKLIIVNCNDADDHMLCYLRNEATMDKTRWYGMLNITDDTELLDSLHRDINEQTLELSKINDPRLLSIDIKYLLTANPHNMFNTLATHLAWPVCDEHIFVDVMGRMQELQIPYIEKLKSIKTSYSAVTPAELAILNYLKGEK